jgi:hypothetical protein
MANKLRVSKSGSGAPTAITPDFLGQIYIDEDTGIRYEATALTKGSWVDKLSLKENTANKKTTITSSDTDYPTCKAVETGLAAKQASLGYTAENADNKVTSFQGTPDNIHYPSEKLVKESLDAKLAIASKASSAEINTGTDETKYITPDALAGSNAFTKTVQQYCVEWGTELAVEEGVGYIEIPPECNGMNLISARARVGTAGTTNASTFDIYNVTDSHSMLSSAITIASGTTSGTGTVDTAHDDVATGDIIRIDCDTLSTTKPKGLIVTLVFRLP